MQLDCRESAVACGNHKPPSIAAWPEREVESAQNVTQIPKNCGRGCFIHNSRVPPEVPLAHGS